jgi:hypothetical protein
MHEILSIAALGLAGWFAYMVLNSTYGRPHRVPLPSIVTYYGKPGSLLNPSQLNGHTVFYCVDPSSDVIDLNIDGALYEVTQNWITEAKQSCTAKFVEVKQLA